MKSPNTHKMDFKAKIVYLLILIICGVFISIIFQGRQKVDWCILEYPRSVVKGEKLQIKLTVLNEVPKAPLKIDLHWMNKDRSGFFTYSRQSFIPAAGEVYFYELPIKKLAPYEAVFPVVFLSPGGDWGGSVKQATGQPIALKDMALDETLVMTKKDKPYSMNYQEVIEYQNPSLLGFYLELLLYLLAAGLVVYVVVFARNMTVLAKSLLVFIALAFCVLLVFRLTGFDQRLSSFLRRIFRVNQVYHSRRILQRLALVAVGGAWLLVILLVLRYSGFEFSFKLLLVFASFIFILNISRYVSLHSFDAFFNTRFFSIPIYYVLELGLFFGLYISALIYQRVTIKNY